jgi:acetylornithine deacetylase
MLNPVESRILDLLDRQDMARFLCELVRIPSLGGNEGQAQLRVAEWMRKTGMEVDIWELDMEGLRRHPAYSAEIERETGLGVVGVVGGGGGGRDLILNGHVDVVPPGDQSTWSFSPWEGGIVDGQVRGRGALDMKGGLVAALFAGKAILAAGVRLKGRLILESVIGEEDGGVGTLAAIERGYRADGAVIMEPTGLAICPAQAGALNFRITVRGKAAHGCVRDEGVSALEKFHRVHERLLALEHGRNQSCSDPLYADYGIPFPLSVGVIEGGDWASSVPDWVRVEGRYGIRPGEELGEAKEDFRKALVELGAADPWFRDHPPELEWWGGRFHPARVPDGDPVVLGLQGASHALGLEPRPLKGVTFGSDMRLLVREGATPTVLFGPGDIRRAHAADEAVSLKDVHVAARILALTALRFCGYEDEPFV